MVGEPALASLSVVPAPSLALVSLICVGVALAAAVLALLFLALVIVFAKLAGIIGDGSTDAAPIGVCIGSSRICLDRCVCIKQRTARKEISNRCQLGLRSSSRTHLLEGPCGC